MRNRQTMKQAGALLLSLAIIGGTVFPAGQIRAAAETKQPENSMKAATVSDAEKIPGTTVPGLLSRRPETMGKKTEQRRRGLCFRFLQQCPVGFGSRD